MTPRERAEKILYLCIKPAENVNDKCAIGLIAAEIEAYASERIQAAQLEILEQNEPLVALRIQAAVSESLKDYATVNGGLWKIKVSQAYEDAAKIAETAKQAAGLSAMGPLTACGLIADRIRARAAELDK